MRLLCSAVEADGKYGPGLRGGEPCQVLISWRVTTACGRSLTVTRFPTPEVTGFGDERVPTCPECMDVVAADAARMLTPGGRR